MTESNSNLPKVGKLVPVDIRKVWEHEASSFTPWVLENSDRLSEALGLDLEIEAAEHPVGNFSLDLIGRDLESGQRVIIENQLEVTDHTHLGQIMTYAGGTDPKVIVWIAKSFREEHAAALQWLNENTDEEINFYGVEVSAVQIDDSRPAALFNLVVRPNKWEKSVRTSTSRSTSRSAKAERYAEFWALFGEKLSDLNVAWNSEIRKSTNYANWNSFRTDVKGIIYSISFAGAFGARTQFAGQKALRSEIYIGSHDPLLNTERFEIFESLKADLERLVGAELSFEPLDGKKACRIAIYAPGSIDDEEQWSSAVEFFITTQQKLRSAISSLGGLEQILTETL